MSHGAETMIGEATAVLDAADCRRYGMTVGIDQVER